jgi:phage tail sheath gpL-like
MTLTKLQTLYRAAVAADASVAINGLGINPDGVWYVMVGNTKHSVWILHEHAERIIADELHAFIEDVPDILERIARKEASK